MAPFPMRMLVVCFASMFAIQEAGTVEAGKQGFLQAQFPEEGSDAALFGGGRMISGDAEESSDMALYGNYQGEANHQSHSEEDDSGSESDLALYGGRRGRAQSGVAEEGSDAALYGGAASLMQAAEGQHVHAVGKVNAGWSLALKTSGDKTFGFSSPYWTNDKLLNENSKPEAAGNAKYPAFNNVAFSKIAMCVGSPTSNCVQHKFNKEYTSARALFKAGYIRDTSVDQVGILHAFRPAKDSYQNCPMQRPGFNIQCNDGNKARWGYCLNCASQTCQNSDSNDADAAIGIGLAGQSTPAEMGAGWTNYFASGKGACSPNSKKAQQVWFYVGSLPRGGIGEECKKDNDCVTHKCDTDGSYDCQGLCVSAMADQTRHCMTKGIGETCSSDRQCRSGACDLANFYGCDHKCVSGNTTAYATGTRKCNKKDIGELCTSDSQCDSGTCDTKNKYGCKGKCVTPVKLSESSPSTIGVKPFWAGDKPHCAVKYIGQTCLNDSECLSSKCELHGRFGCKNKCVSAKGKCDVADVLESFGKAIFGVK